MPSKQADLNAHKEGRFLLAIKAIQKDQISSIQVAAQAYDVPYLTLIYCFYEYTAWADSILNN